MPKATLPNRIAGEATPASILYVDHMPCQHSELWPAIGQLGSSINDVRRLHIRMFPCFNEYLEAEKLQNAWKSFKRLRCRRGGQCHGHCVPTLSVADMGAPRISGPVRLQSSLMGQRQVRHSRVSAFIRIPLVRFRRLKTDVRGPNVDAEVPL
jgi:hypothetical protein